LLIFHTIGPADLHPSPAPHFRNFQVFLIYFPKCVLIYLSEKEKLSNEDVDRTPISHHFNNHSYSAYWQGYGLDVIYLDVLCNVRRMEQETGRNTDTRTYVLVGM